MYISNSPIRGWGYKAERKGDKGNKNVHTWERVKMPCFWAEDKLKTAIAPDTKGTINSVYSCGRGTFASPEFLKRPSPAILILGSY